MLKIEFNRKAFSLRSQNFLPVFAVQLFIDFSAHKFVAAPWHISNAANECGTRRSPSWGMCGRPRHTSRHIQIHIRRTHFAAAQPPPNNICKALTTAVIKMHEAGLEAGKKIATAIKCVSVCT